jgi:hypothetical protein
MGCGSSTPVEEAGGDTRKVNVSAQDANKAGDGEKPGRLPAGGALAPAWRDGTAHAAALLGDRCAATAASAAKDDAGAKGKTTRARRLSYVTADANGQASVGAGRWGPPTVTFATTSSTLTVSPRGPGLAGRHARPGGHASAAPPRPDSPQTGPHMLQNGAGMQGNAGAAHAAAIAAAAPQGAGAPTAGAKPTTPQGSDGSKASANTRARRLSYFTNDPNVKTPADMDPGAQGVEVEEGDESGDPPHVEHAATPDVSGRRRGQRSRDGPTSHTHVDRITS